MRIVDILVEPFDDLPDGCSMRFKAHGEVRAISRISYESEAGLAGAWTVEAAWADGRHASARTVPVEDSSAGSSNLVFGGDRGLRLTSIETGAIVAEPFLLLADPALLES